MAPKVLYHASPVQGLKVLRPRKSTHGKSWVYACEDKVTVSFFISRMGGDFTCSMGTSKSRKYICERFRDALDYRYGSKKGSIYEVNGSPFEGGKTSWIPEFVSPVPVPVLSERRFSDALQHLFDLEKEGLVDIYRFPDRPSCVPADDEDLVKRAREWSKSIGPHVLRQFKEYHPDLASRV